MDPRFRAWQEQVASKRQVNPRQIVSLPAPQPLKEVLTHEGWNLYAQYLEGLRLQWEGSAKAYEAHVLAAPDAAIPDRIAVAFSRGHAQAYTRALAVIHDLINEGKPPALTDREDPPAPV